MLRRRRKGPKEIVPAGVPSAAPGSRRRPRPGAQVPSELIVRERPLLAERKPKPEPQAAVAKPRKGDTVLVTGFDAFCGESVNPSWQVCEALPRDIAGLRVHTCRIPCEFDRAIEVATKAIDQHKPAIVICLGQAGGRAHLSVERVAINIDDARVEDNARKRPIDEPIARDGPPAYFATLPIKSMVEGMRAAGVPAEVSNSAGTYVCNHLMYGVLHFLRDRAGVRAGFIHVPYSEEQVLDKPAIAAMAVTSMVKGVEAAIVAAHRHASDLKVEGGFLD
jgi:pyroglutamyl-peptidase